MRVHETVHKYIYFLYTTLSLTQLMPWDLCFCVIVAAVEPSQEELHAGNSFTWKDKGKCGEMMGDTLEGGKTQTPPTGTVWPGAKYYLSVLPSHLQCRNASNPSISQLWETPHLSGTGWCSMQVLIPASFQPQPGRAESCGLLRRSEQLRTDPVSTPWRVHDFISSELRRQKCSFFF